MPGFIKPLCCAAGGLAILAIVAYLAAHGLSADRAPADPVVWFEDIAGPLPLRDAEAEAALHAAARALRRPGTALGRLPRRLAADRQPRVLFLAASDGVSAAEVATGTGRGFHAALLDALRAMGKRGVAGQDAVWLKLEIVTAAGAPFDAARGDLIDLPGQRGRVGLAFARAVGLALPPGELGQSQVVGPAGDFQPRMLRRHLRVRGIGGRAAHTALAARTHRLRSFSTVSFFLDNDRFAAGERPAVEHPALLAAAREAGDYLRRMVDGRGRFVYRYLPRSGRLGRDYNMVRHAGAIYAMMELYQVEPQADLLRAARRAIGHLLRYVVDFGDPAAAQSALAYNGKIKLGGVALAVVALARYTEATGDGKHLPVMRRLARYIVASHDDDGRSVHIRYHPSGRIDAGFQSRYYPGEAMLALTRLYPLDPRDEWLDTAEAAARYLITVRDRGLRTARLTHDHWLLYALDDLHRHRPNELYLEHALHIARAIMLFQNRDRADPGYGSFANPPRTTPTATRMEGLVAAHQLARLSGRLGHAERIRDALELGIGFVMSNQYRPQTAIHLADPARALGGFRHSPPGDEIRIDYVQHALSALLGYAAILSADRQ